MVRSRRAAGFLSSLAAQRARAELLGQSSGAYGAGRFPHAWVHQHRRIAFSVGFAESRAACFAGPHAAVLARFLAAPYECVLARAVAARAWLWQVR